MFKNREERKRQKLMKQMEDIAVAFLKARGVYPPDYEGFLRVAGQKDVDLFNATMLLIDQRSETIGVDFTWWYDPADKEWKYEFVPIEEGAKDMN